MLESCHIAVFGCDEPISRLRRTAARLEGFLDESEREFLAVGSRLSEFHQNSSAVVAAARSAVENIVGRKGSQAREGLGALVDRLDAQVSTARTEMAGAEEALTGILAPLREIESAQTGFQRLVRTLGILGISTRIESVRLVSARSGFDTIAQQVRDLTVRIRKELDAITDHESILSGQLTQALFVLRTAGDLQRAGALQIFSRTRASLEFLRETHERGSSAAGVVAENSALIKENISRIVQSMQFQDITRQGMEHVREALLQLSSDLESGQSADEAGIQSVLALQEAQLAASTGSLVEALFEVMGNLKAVSTHSDALSRETREVLGILDPAGSAFLSELELGLAPVKVLISETAAAGREIASTLHKVAATAAEMARFAAEIERIGAEIRLIALNASVKAAHTGTEGAALGVLAEAMARLSTDARGRTREITDPLCRMVESAERMREDFEQRTRTAGGTNGLDSIMGDLDSLLLGLHGLNEDIVRSLQETEGGAQALGLAIQEAVDRITLVDQAAGMSREIGEELRSLRAAAEGGESGPGAGPPAALFSGLSRRYTTDHERQVHGQMVQQRQGGVVPQESGNRVGSRAGDDDLGDNVELF